MIESLQLNDIICGIYGFYRTNNINLIIKEIFDNYIIAIDNDDDTVMIHKEDIIIGSDNLLVYYELIPMSSDLIPSFRYPLFSSINLNRYNER